MNRKNILVVFIQIAAVNSKFVSYIEKLTEDDAIPPTTHYYIATQLYPVVLNRFLLDSLLKIKRYIFLNKLSCPHSFVIYFGIVKTVWCYPVQRGGVG